MAATVDQTFTMGGVPLPETRVDLSSLDAGEVENIAHGGPSGVPVRSVQMEVITRPTDGSDVRMEHLATSDSTTNDTVALKFYTSAGGSLTGAKVRLRFIFGSMKSGGITPFTKSNS